MTYGLPKGTRIYFDGGFQALTGTEQRERYSFDDAESSPLMQTIVGYSLDGKVFGGAKCLALSLRR
jgi:hypothetical protein